MASACPSPRELQSWLAQGGETDPSEQFVSHVAGCAGCQELLDGFSDDPALRYWADRLADTTADGDTAGPSGLIAESNFPDRIEPYRIIRELGRGGMGVVYLAEDEKLRRQVALKLIRRDSLKPETRERFLREVRAAARIRHDHVVGVYHAGSLADGAPFLAMEYVAGPALSALIRVRERLTPAEAADLGIQIAAGLSAVHRAGLIHRDVKPANVLIASEPVCERPRLCKLADFGMVRDDSESGLTGSGTIAGTPAYLSPEQARGEPADPRSDIYGLGITMYEMLVGEPPFRGPPHQVLRQILEEEPRPPRRIDATIPADLETIILKAMAREPAGRYPAIDDLAADLRRWRAGEPILARPVSRPERLWRWGRRNPALAAVTVLALAALLALAVGGPAAAIIVNRSHAHAEQARRQAEADYESAVASYVTLVNSVRKHMGDQPGLLPLRKRLLETAADGLHKAIRDHGSSPRSVEVAAAAHLHLGEVLQDLGRTPESEAQYAAALRLGEDWARREPENVAALRAWANPADRLGNLARFARKPDAAREYYTLALRRRERIAELEAGAAVARRDLSVSHNKLGDLAGEAGDWESARTHAVDALELTELLRPDSERKEWLMDMRFCRSRLADALLELGECDEAESQAAAALEDARQVSALDAAAGRIETLYALERLAGVASSRLNPGRAVTYRRDAVALRRQVIDADPDNESARRALASSLYALGLAHGAAKEYSSARAAFAEALDIIGEATRRDPDSAHWANNLVIAFTGAIIVEENAGDYAGAARRTSELVAACRRMEANPKLAHLRVDARRAQAERDLAAYREFIDEGVDAPARLPGELDGVARKLRRMRVIEAARTGRLDAVSSLDVAGNSEDAFAAARAFARVNDTGGAAAHLRNAARLDPVIAKNLVSYPEFVALRDTPGFRGFVAGLPAEIRRAGRKP